MKSTSTNWPGLWSRSWPDGLCLACLLGFAALRRFALLLFGLHCLALLLCFVVLVCCFAWLAWLGLPRFVPAWGGVGVLRTPPEPRAARPPPLGGAQAANHHLTCCWGSAFYEPPSSRGQPAHRPWGVFQEPPPRAVANWGFIGCKLFCFFELFPNDAPQGKCPRGFLFQPARSSPLRSSSTNAACQAAVKMLASATGAWRGLQEM